MKQDRVTSLARGRISKDLEEFGKLTVQMTLRGNVLQAKETANVKILIQRPFWNVLA